MASSQKAATMTGAQLRHLLRVTDATSRAPERDRLVLLDDAARAIRVEDPSKGEDDGMGDAQRLNEA